MKKDEYKDIVISLHQNWWEEMKAGRKLLEIRKTRPQGKGPYTVIVYVTGGVGIVGEFVCDCFYQIPTKQIPVWALPEDEEKPPYNLEKASCLTRQQLQQYAGDTDKPLWGWHITKLVEYDTRLTLSDLGIKTAPQSWCYSKLGGAA